jgi:CBS domain containing-hemolysin-like protein
MPTFSWLGRLFSGKDQSESRQRGTPEGASPGNGGSSSRGQGLTATEHHAGLEVLPDEPAITEEELSGLDQRDRKMLRSIIDLDYTTVREVMVPRLDMVAIDVSVSLHEAAAAIVEYGHSRLPVYDETVDEILGILYVRDLLAAIAGPQNETDVRALTRQAFVVPETKRVDELLEEFRQRHTQIAIVVDEYGGTEGLVTMEDVLEEIVGEIEDEFSRGHDAEIARQDDGTVYVTSGLSTEEVEELFGVNIESDDFDTVGGFVYHHLGRIPHVGDVVEREGLRVEVASVAGRRLRSLKINKENGGPPVESG